MPRRQLKRTPNEAAVKRRHLSLVKPPKRKRSWKVPRAVLKRKYEHHHELHIFEEELILATLVKRGGYGSPQSLMREEPERWRKGYLKFAFKRMSNSGKLTRIGRTANPFTRYEIPKEAPK